MKVARAERLYGRGRADMAIAHKACTVAALRLVVHTPATGGVLMHRDQAVCRMTVAQYALVEILLKQYLDDEAKEGAVRGFVSSEILLCSIPWDAVHPGLSHLKQLVRRVRHKVRRTGTTVQGWGGLGYRLCAGEDDESEAGELAGSDDGAG